MRDAVNTERWTIVIKDCALPLTIESSRARNTGDINEESLIGLDRRIAVDGNVELICLLARGNCRPGYGVRDIIIVGSRGRAVGRRDVECHCRGRGGGQANCESKGL